VITLTRKDQFGTILQAGVPAAQSALAGTVDVSTASGGVAHLDPEPTREFARGLLELADQAEQQIIDREETP
jgi:hypothetical protein